MVLFTWTLTAPLLLLLSAAVPEQCCCCGNPLLTESSADTSSVSTCVLSCTAHTYRAMLERGDKRTVRMKSARADEPDGHCWSVPTGCGPEEQLQNAYVVLPMHFTRSGAREALRLQPTQHAHLGLLKPFYGSMLLSKSCGLRFDATRHFLADQNQPTFCVKVVPSLSSLGVELKCPPFLVTTWLQQHSMPT